MGFRNICRIFADVALPKEFVFRVLDIDGISHAVVENLRTQPVVVGGNAEGYWFLNGSISSATNYHSATEEHVRLLLAKERGTKIPLSFHLR